MVLMQLIRFIERKKQTNKKNIDTIYENNKSEKKKARSPSNYSISKNTSYIFNRQGAFMCLTAFFRRTIHCPVSLK